MVRSATAIDGVEWQPWLVTGDGCARVAASVADAVGASPRPVAHPAPPPGDSPGVLVCDHVDDEVVRFAREVSRAGERRVLVLVTGTAAESPAAWDLLRAGIADVLPWDGDSDAIAARLNRWRQVDELVAAPVVAEHLVGHSRAWRSVIREVVELAHFSELDVLITGESGTGKELTARLIHTLDPRPDKGGLVVVDCTTIVPTLSGSEFFGHERGAFTGADSARDGAFARADGGTLFLDEVGELPATLQAELLRVVQEGTYKRVGSNRWQTTRFRLLCATNRDLEEARARGAFRSDLYFRLAAAIVELPALGQRREDILTLTRHFLADGTGRAPPITPAVCDLLRSRAYPGNVRDLEQLVARILLRHVGPGPVTVGDVPPPERPRGDPADDWRDDLEAALRGAVHRGVPLKDIVEASRDAAIAVALAAAGGSLRQAARRLGVTDRTLQLHRARRRAPP